MRSARCAAVLVMVFMLSACTLHIPPYDWGGSYSEYRVVLDVKPDDAEVILDGKFIGEVYEFSTFKSALILPSRNHDLVIKKDGFREVRINLRDYSSREINIRFRLRKDGEAEDADEIDEERRESKPPSQKDERLKPEYIPKREPVREPPRKPEAKEPVEAGKPVQLTLEISPIESSIYLDGKFWGISPENGIINNIRLKPGKYTLEVVKPGYKSFKKVLEVKSKELKIIVRLMKK